VSGQAIALNVQFTIREQHCQKQINPANIQRHMEKPALQKKKIFNGLVVATFACLRLFHYHEKKLPAFLGLW